MLLYDYEGLKGNNATSVDENRRWYHTNDDSLDQVETYENFLFAVLCSLFYFVSFFSVFDLLLEILLVLSVKLIGIEVEAIEENVDSVEEE